MLQILCHWHLPCDRPEAVNEVTLEAEEPREDSRHVDWIDIFGQPTKRHAHLRGDGEAPEAMPLVGDYLGDAVGQWALGVVWRVTLMSGEECAARYPSECSAH